MRWWTQIQNIAIKNGINLLHVWIIIFFFCLCACAGYIFSSTANLFPEFLTPPSSSPNKKVKKNRVKGLVCLLQWYGSKCQWQSHNGSRQNTGVYHLIVDHVPFGMFHQGVQTQESAEKMLLWPTGFIFLSLDSPGEAYKMSCGNYFSKKNNTVLIYLLLLYNKVS